MLRYLGFRANPNNCTKTHSGSLVLNLSAQYVFFPKGLMYTDIIDPPGSSLGTKKRKKKLQIVCTRPSVKTKLS